MNGWTGHHHGATPVPAHRELTTGQSDGERFAHATARSLDGRQEVEGGAAGSRTTTAGQGCPGAALPGDLLEERAYWCWRWCCVWRWWWRRSTVRTQPTEEGDVRTGLTDHRVSFQRRAQPAEALSAERCILVEGYDQMRIAHVHEEHTLEALAVHLHTEC
jgi:hypothetical protein